MLKQVAAILLFLVAGVFGQEEYFGQNKIQYRKLDWYIIQTRNFDIYFYKGQDTIAIFAAGVLEDAYRQVSAELNHKLTARVPIIIYSSPNDFQQTNVIPDLLPEGVGGFTEIFKNRVVVPFNGSYEDFRHVLHHELAHAVVFNLLYENAVSSLLSRQAFFSPPLWFAEGYAEYTSRKGWDYEADMYLRDAAISGYLPELDKLEGFLNYKAGQSAIIYIVETYGPQRIHELLNKGKVLLTMNRAIKATLNMEIKKLSEDWQRELRRIYWPEISKRKTADEVGKLLTNHQKDGSIYNQHPVWSPRGDRLVITSDRANPKDGYGDRFNEIYIISAIDGHVIQRVVRAERSADLESLHSYFSGMSWSPAGDRLVFVARSKGNDGLVFFDVQRRKVVSRFTPPLEALRSPHWSATGDKVVVTGLKSGFSDLYIYDLATGEMSRLTFDRYDDIDAKFSPDGTKIAFASDRPVATSQDSVFRYGVYNVFIYDLQKNTITVVTADTTKSYQPDFSPDGKMLAYVSYRSGIANIYVRNLETGEDFPVTNVLGGVFSPSWSPDGDKLAASIFNHSGFDIVTIQDIRPVSDSGGLEPTTFALTGRLFPEKTPLPAFTESGSSVGADTMRKLDFSRHIFRAEEETPGGAGGGESPQEEPRDTTLAALKETLPDTLEYLTPEGTYRRKRYSPKFAPELISGGFSYDTFYGLQGQSYIAISDVLGNHQFMLATDVINTLDQSNIEVIYSYVARRIDYAVGAFHLKNLYYDYYNDLYFTDRIYGVLAAASYPLSRFHRVDLNLSQITIDRNYLDYFAPPNSTTNILVGGISYVSDRVIWGLVGPVFGERYKLSVEKSFKAVSTGYSYLALEGDYRKYIHFGDDYNFALRGAAGHSRGPNARRFYLGGTSYWIDPRQGTEDVYGVSDIYINKLVVPLRGYRYFEFGGKNYFLFNMELRYPFVDYLKIRFPFGMTLGYIRGSLFYDMGAAFDEASQFRLFDRQKGFPKLGTPRSGIGFSIQSNLGLFVLRFDTAWKTDLTRIWGHPQYYFSLGANY